MVKEFGDTLEDYMNNNVVEEFQPFYINEINITEGNADDYWGDGGNSLRLKQGYGPTTNIDPDYFAVAVKQGFEVEIALRSDALFYFDTLTNIGDDPRYEKLAIGNDQFLRFTMTGGGFLEISGGFDRWPASDIYAEDFSQIEEQIANTAISNALINDVPNERIRFSADGYTIYTIHAIGSANILNPRLWVILDGVKTPTYEVEDPNQPTLEQVTFTPQGEDSTTKEDIGIWELIHESRGQQWNIVELNSPTESKTWAFYFNGALISAFESKNDAMIALDFHYKNWIIANTEEEKVFVYDSATAFIYSVGIIFMTRFLGRLVI
mgnify:CR=1 FL=1